MLIKTICEELEKAIEANEKAGASPVKSVFAGAVKKCGREGCGATPGRSCKNYPPAGDQAESCGCKEERGDPADCPRCGDGDTEGVCWFCGKNAGGSVVIKFVAEPENTRKCPVCKKRFYTAGKTWAYLEGTNAPVCVNCAGPRLAALLDAKSRHDAQICEAMDTIKAAKLEHYRERPPMLFCQIDGFVDAPADDLSSPDAHGVAVFGGETWELMHSSTVRVLIRADATRDEAERGLKSISEAVANGFIDDDLEKDINTEALERAEVLQRQDSNSMPF